MNRKGAITTYVLVFGGTFLVLIGGLFNLILFQLKQGTRRVAWNESFEVAEAGINYYQWCLNNKAEDVCQSEKDYYDLEGNLVGTFTLQIESEMSCGESIRDNVVSVGWTKEFSDIQRSIGASFGQESVARYAYLLDDNVWAGSDREIRGFYYSNGGIRMDGENQSLVTSAQNDWLCTSSFGCDWYDCPSDCSPEGQACRCPGVFTTTGNSNPDLFMWPATYFDFEGVTIDLARIKSLVEAYPQYKYWPPVIDIDSQGKGYHLKLKETSQAEIWIITGLNADWAYSQEEGWHYDHFSIADEYLYKTVNIDPSCSLMFFEDDLWVDGIVEGKITIVSANLISPTKETSIVLVSDIDYADIDGSDGLALIAEENILISPDSPNVMELRGIFMAQKGHFGRNCYYYDINEKLEIYGSIISNGRVGTKWISGSQVVSGYLKRENYIDANLIHGAPPFVPSISDDFVISDWEEIE